MERVSGLLSWTLSRVLWLSGFSEHGAAWQPRIMEEKALEVYGNLPRALFDVFLERGWRKASPLGWSGHLGFLPDLEGSVFFRVLSHTAVSGYS